MMNEEQTYKQKYGSREKFHKEKGIQQIAARTRPIWVLLATPANMDGRAPLFKRDINEEVDGKLDDQA